MVAPSWEQFQKPKQPALTAPISSPTPQEKVGDITDSISPEGRKPQWGDFLTPMTFQGANKPIEEEGWLSWFSRNAVQNVSRAGEAVFGLPGNLQKLHREASSSLAPFVSWATGNLIGEEKWKSLFTPLLTLPTSESIRQKASELTGGFTEPKNKLEERVGELTGDVVSMFIPPTGFTKVIPKILIPSAANGVKTIVDSIGFGEDKANMAKLAVWLPLTLAKSINAPKYASDLMNKGRTAIPEDLKINSSAFRDKLNEVNKTLLNSDPRTALARNAISGLEQDLKNGQDSVRSLMTAYDGINAAKRSRGMFELGKRDQIFATKSIDKVRDLLREEILNSASQYPEALKNWKDGISAWAVIHRSNALTNMLEKQAKGPYAKILQGPAAALFGLGAYSTTQVPQVAGVASATVPAAYKTGQAIYRMWNHPELNKYYWNALFELSRENLSAFSKNYVKLNKGLEKLESKESDLKE